MEDREKSEKIKQLNAVKYLRFLYPIWTIIGLFSIMYVPSTLIVLGDSLTTANNIISNNLLFNLGIIGSLMTQLIHIWVVLLLYRLFKPVDVKNSLILVILGLVGVPIAMLNTLNLVAARLLLSGADYLKVFEIDQLQALSMFFINLNNEGILIATIFWGLWLFPLGILIYKSNYFPKILGIFMLISGTGFFIQPFLHYLIPSLESIFLPVIYIMTMGELLFMIWVLFKGAKIS
ncbi:DUF4386 domain-containing protein [Candidatus Pacearchaeota archaeon]|nr:DUF4386 domain-containing protein [Candidatus Pacearchaeota archaeon]